MLFTQNVYRNCSFPHLFKMFTQNIKFKPSREPSNFQVTLRSLDPKEHNFSIPRRLEEANKLPMISSSPKHAFNLSSIYHNFIFLLLHNIQQSRNYLFWSITHGTIIPQEESTTSILLYQIWTYVYKNTKDKFKKIDKQTQYYLVILASQKPYTRI